MVGERAEVTRISEIRRRPGRIIRPPPLKDGFQGVAVIPAKVLRIEDSLVEVRRVLGTEANDGCCALIGFPEFVKFSTFPGGIEFYDTDSTRPSPRKPDETLIAPMTWVKKWYFSIFQQGDKLMGRYINKKDDHNGLPTLEQPIRDPETRIGKYTFRTFTETIIFEERP